MVKLCEKCGDEFETAYDSKVYCSIQCKRSAKSKRKDARNVHSKMNLRKCKFCGDYYTPYTRGNDFCNSKCKSNYKAMEFKKTVKNLGLNFCWKCGYDEESCAIDMHHIDPKTKTLRLQGASQGLTNGQRKEVIAELKTCASLCAVCHRVYHFTDLEGMTFLEWLDE